MTPGLLPTILVGMDRERLSQAVAAAVRQTPTSIRALARRAGLSHVTLLQVRDGDRPASRGIGEAVARALEEQSREAAALAEEIREALEQDSE